MAKLATGIEGFDELSGGGLPRHRTTLLIGGPGSGKPVFALQCLVNAASLRVPGIFVAFEESPAQIMANGATFNWGLASLATREIFFLDAHLSPTLVMAGDFDLTGMLAMLAASGYATAEFPVSFGPSGIEVGAADTAQIEHKASSERITAGFQRLDAMLGGGVFRGSSTLITGVPGTPRLPWQANSPKRPAGVASVPCS